MSGAPRPGASDSAPALEMRDLRVRFEGDRGTVHAVSGVSFRLRRGRTLAVVGESGSGKTVTALACMGLLPPSARMEARELRIGDRSVLGFGESDWQTVRGREVAMVFQDPLTSLNPVLTVGRQMTEGLRHHLGLDARAARDRAVDLLTRVGIPDAKGRLADHPHEFSGGQRQRIGIAMALACDPTVLIADEPTTALDVTIQKQIVDLVQRIQADTGTAILWITHDLALVASFAHDVLVLYGGTVVETAPASSLYAWPRHPYTVGLLRSLPRLEQGSERLEAIEGNPPELHVPLAGCPFAPRCGLAEARCFTERPQLRPTDTGGRSACWRWEELVGGPDEALVASPDGTESIGPGAAT